jgi:endonuclease/exonuclease/phosphatase family metal-dependent hydrolase
MPLKRSAPLLLAAFLAFPAAAEELTVMSFNVRYPEPKDGDNAWEKRHDLLVAAIRAKSPDLFGTQELFHLQGEYIVEKATEYAWFGLSRRGNQENEHMGVFYKKDRLRVIESGNFWLSETPEVPASMSWNVSLPRMVTWALFELRPSGRRFYFYNTHFAHRREDEEARLKSADVIVSRIAKLSASVPFVMTGDFNAPAGGPVQKKFLETLTDAWTAAPADKRTGPEGTFHGFRGQPSNARIDWVLYRGPWRVLEAETVTYNQSGQYPSDHFPVFVRLALD